ncbi:MAG TPA: MFS transporter [Xanthobacteraceae bacterium]|nr:MFS transporter [Xanthobacteraceae bacterium]
MTDTSPARPRPTVAEALAVYLRPRVLIVMFLGFSSGLPLALSGSTLLFWMREAGVDLGTIGLFALVGTPYTVKFLWAPLVDAVDLPVLSRLLGGRRAWLLLSQLWLMGAIVLLGLCDPAASPWLVAVGAIMVATASATQDIVVDAFRIESLAENEQAAGMASYVAAYRIGMLASTAGALFLVSGAEGLGLARPAAWSAGYAAMAALVLVGIIATFVATEPEKSTAVRAAKAGQAERRRMVRTSLMLMAAVLCLFIVVRQVTMLLLSAFPAMQRLELVPTLLIPAVILVLAAREFRHRRHVIAILTFVVLFKFTDALSGTMTPPFVYDLGFSRNEYAAIIKGVGLAATLLGGFAGGFVARAWPLALCLLIGGTLQAAANLAFSWQAMVGHDIVWLTFAIVVENFTSAIGTVIFVAYLSALCNNPLNTATQYAVLTALAALGRTFLSAGAGYIATATGWPWFFAICALAAMPSLLLLAWLQRRGHFAALGPSTGPSG